MSVVDQVSVLLRSLRPELNFSDSQHFVNDGLLDSYDIVILVATLEQTFGIMVDGVEILPDHFASAHAIAELVERSRSKS